jgi:hypothetical protein
MSNGRKRVEPPLLHLLADALRESRAATSEVSGLVRAEQGSQPVGGLTSGYGPRNRSPSKWIMCSGSSATQTSVSHEIWVRKLRMGGAYHGYRQVRNRKVNEALV